MKNNKGFAPIAIIFIIIAVLAVGGVAYYTGKSSKTAPKNIEENSINLSQENQNNIANTPVTNLNITTNDLTITEPKTTPCLSTTVPWVKVLSPNGGETFTVEQYPGMLTKWKSCNIETGNVAIGLKNITTGNEKFLLVSPDSGTTNVLLPSEFFSSGNYKVVICNTKLDPNATLDVSYINDCSVLDYSDNSFTIQ